MPTEKGDEKMFKIKVKFRGCSELIDYTSDILALLVTEPDVELIIKSSTGEAIWTK